MQNEKRDESVYILAGLPDNKNTKIARKTRFRKFHTKKIRIIRKRIDDFWAS